MEPTAPRKIKLGDFLDATVVKSMGGRRFALKCKNIPNGWKAELHSRRPEGIRPGSLGTFWVAKVSPLQGSILVHDGDFGRLPISDAMRARYLTALTALLEGPEISGDELADARSMVLRIEKTDQADWLSAWKALGEPDTGDVKHLLAGITAIRDARKEAPDTVPALREKLIEKYGGTLRLAINRLK